MTQPAEPLIELMDADVPRADVISPVAVIRGVRWTVNRGEFWAVGAAPGNGKTDLLSTAATLQRPIQGFHLVFGKDIAHMDEDEIVQTHLRLGMVFDDGRLFSELTVLENVALPLAYHLPGSQAELNERAAAALELVNLAEVKGRRPPQVTRTLHQRIGLARALALNPEVILIDNPLSMIDPRQARWWLEFLSQLQKGHAFFANKPMTIVVTADDLRPWLDVSQHFAVIKDRRFEVLGGKAQVCASEDAAVRDLLSAAYED